MKVIYETTSDYRYAKEIDKKANSIDFMDSMVLPEWEWKDIDKNAGEQENKQ